MKTNSTWRLVLPRRLFGFAGVLLLALTGCFPLALHPFYRQKDVVFDRALLGVWAEKEGDDDSWTFETGTNQSYRVTVKDEKRSDHLEGFLFKLGTNTFLDLTVGERTFKEHDLDGFSGLHLVPVHTVARVRLRGDTLTLSFMDLEWLGKLLEKNPNAIRHEMAGVKDNDERLVLTASTSELQAFIQEHLDEAFLKDPDALKRITTKP